MNEITYTFKKLKILTNPAIVGYDNVIAKVVWQIEFTDGTSNSAGMGETEFQFSNPETFIPIEQVTDEVLEQWVIEKEGGVQFINMLKNIHAPMIEKKNKEANLVEYYVDESFAKRPPF